jgi:hypothetical protein
VGYQKVARTTRNPKRRDEDFSSAVTRHQRADVAKRRRTTSTSEDEDEGFLVKLAS